MTSSPDGSTLRPPGRGDRANEAPSDRPSVHLPTIGRFGPYEIAGRLALGGMAEILLARESIEGAGSRYLVVKRILQQYENEPDFVDMFFDEARVGIRVTHPNICHIYKFGQQDGTPYIALEWVNGEALGRLIRRAREHGGIPIPIVCHVVGRVAEALHGAHDAVDENGRPLELVHRDVTPHNIMVSYDGSVKLLDFGIAKSESSAHRTQAGVIKGKFAYMAPEQIEGSDIDRRVDIFALGVCLYEALTGKPLYHRKSEVETMRAIALEPVPRLRGGRPFAPELEAIVQRALAKAPAERYRTAREMQEALDRYLTRSQHVVNAGHVTEMMRKLFQSEIERGPSVDTTPFGSSYHADVEELQLDKELAARRERASQPYPGPGRLEPSLDVSALPAPSGGARGVSGTREIDLDPSPGAPVELGLGLPPRPADVDTSAAAGPARRRPAAARAAAATRAATGDTGLPGWVKGAVALGLLASLGAAAWALVPRLVGDRDALGQDATPTIDVMGPPGSTSLLVESDPPGAVVSVAGREAGRTPVRLGDLEAGKHAVSVALEGYQPWTADVELEPGGTRSVEAVLLPETPPEDAPKGFLTLETQPPTKVFLFGEPIGETPLRRVRVPAGVLVVELETADGERARRRVVVREREETPTVIDLTDELR